jgi:hypothetical protein
VAAERVGARLLCHRGAYVVSVGRFIRGNVRSWRDQSPILGSRGTRAGQAFVCMLK